MTVADVRSPAGVGVPEGWVAGTWTIDPAHSTVSFAVRHLMSRVRGTFSEVSGQIVTSADPSRSTATAAVAVSSVSTGNQVRDDHLRSVDFFDAVLIASLRVLPAAAAAGRGRLDVPGAVLATAAMLVATWAITSAGPAGWASASTSSPPSSPG